MPAHFRYDCIQIRRKLLWRWNFLNSQWTRHDLHLLELIIKVNRRLDPQFFLFNLAKTDKNDVITEVFKSKAILVGSPTINRGILVSVAGILEEIKGLKFKNKKAAAFGCYGWSGESVKIISGVLEESGFDIIDEGLRVMWNPDAEGVSKCVKFGKRFAADVPFYVLPWSSQTI